ncbi:MAG: cytidylyltransferase domain-containing protein [Phycisphaerales bacterium JB039]
MDALAIILGRAGSKGLPGKNTAAVAGRPCALWTIDAALEAGSVGRIGVSTDDPALQDLGAAAGVDIWPRPAPLASDTATIDDAARHALTCAEEDSPLAPDYPIVLLYANVPVRPPDLIDRALALLTETGADSVQSFAPVGKFHPWWTARVGPDGRLAPWEGRQLFAGVYRRQQLPPAYVPDGGVIAVTRRALRLEIDDVAPGPHAFLGRDRRAVITEPGEVIDIDTPIDLLVADATLRARQAHV